MKKASKLTALALASLMILSGCGAKTGKDSKDSGKKEESGFKPNPVVENEGTPIENGTIKIGIISESPFKGIFHEAFAGDNFDMTIMNWVGMGGFFDGDPDFKLGNTGLGKIEFKKEEKKAIITIHEKATWSDGVPVTAKDFLRYYLIVGHPDYEGVRFGTDYMNVIGMQEYHDGKAKDVSGVKILSDKSLEVSFKEFDHSIYWGKGIPFNPVPDHIYKDIPVKEQATADATRKHPLSFGPYVIKEIVPGQQVIAEANPYYAFGKPKTPRMEIKAVPSAQVVAAAKSGEYDIIDSFSSDLYEKFAALKNGKIASNYYGGYGYISFKLGKWNKEKNEVVTDPNAKMADKNLRKAMAMAVDRDTVNKKLQNNLSIPLYQLIPPMFATIYDKDFEGIKYDLEGAKKVLDEAGYKDTNGDGIREDKNGKPLKINFAAMQGSSTQEPTVQFFLQQWKAIGLDVQLVTGRLIEFNSFYEKIENDDPEIDAYMGGWSTGSNPDPTGFYGRHEVFNFQRFASPELDKLLADIVTLDNTDPSVRLQHYKDLSKYLVVDEAVVIPIFSQTTKSFVNNRVKKYDTSLPKEGVAPFRNSDLELTKESPDVDK